MISLREKGDNSIIAALPARESETNSISLNGCEPERQNKPFESWLSHDCLICLNKDGTYWISSKKTGGSFKDMNISGFVLACSSINGSSNETSFMFGYKCLIKVDFPVCLAPVISTHLKLFLDLSTTSSIALFL